MIVGKERNGLLWGLIGFNVSLQPFLASADGEPAVEAEDRHARESRYPAA